MQEINHAILAFGSGVAVGQTEVRCEDAGEALGRLIGGNQTYLHTERNPARLTDAIRKDTTEHGQQPYAVVVCCADSRVPPEHIFDAGLGELFVIRNAGNLMGPFDIGSVEYAVEHLGVSLVLMMGHRGCGAVAAALEHAKEQGDLASVLAEVTIGIGDAQDPAEAERRNLLHSMSRLQQSPLLRQLHEKGQVEFAAAIYDIRTGRVEFLK